MQDKLAPLSKCLKTLSVMLMKKRGRQELTTCRSGKYAITFFGIMIFIFMRIKQPFDIKGIKDIHDKPNAWLIEQQKHPISKSDMLAYLTVARQKAFQFIQGINESYFTTPSPFEWHGFPMIDLVDYNLRHLQHHIAYLNIILRREQDLGSPWIMHATLSGQAEMPSDHAK